MKIIMTGATSFIGETLTRKLLADGAEVCAVVRPESPNKRRLEKSGAQMIFCDLNKIEELLENASLYNADIWCQLGWEGVGSLGRSNKEIQSRNIKNCMQTLEVASRLGCHKYFFSGSQAEYGICREKTDEQHPCIPVSEYGKAKLEFYNIAVSRCKELKMNYYHLRIFSVYGPHDHEHSLIHSCIRNFTQGSEMELGNCEQKWNYLYIDDCADAIIRLMKSNAEEGIYNIATEDTRDLKEFIKEINDVLGNKGVCRYGTREPNAEGSTSLIPDITKLQQATGWSAKTDFREGIVKTWRKLYE